MLHFKSVSSKFLPILVERRYFFLFCLPLLSALSFLFCLEIFGSYLIPSFPSLPFFIRQGCCRTHLVDECRQFTDEQLTEVYRCVQETLDSGYPITVEREKTLEAVIDQIEASVEDLEERVNLSNQRELEIMDQQAGDVPGLSF